MLIYLNIYLERLYISSLFYIMSDNDIALYINVRIYNLHFYSSLLGILFLNFFILYSLSRLSIFLIIFTFLYVYNFFVMCFLHDGDACGDEEIIYKIYS